MSFAPDVVHRAPSLTDPEIACIAVTANAIDCTLAELAKSKPRSSALADACVRPVPRSHTVEICGFAYSPGTLGIALGDTVVWINRDVLPHTARGIEQPGIGGANTEQRAARGGGTKAVNRTAVRFIEARGG